MSENATISTSETSPGDVLLLGLAAHYSRAICSNLDFEDAQIEWEGAAQACLSKQAERSWHRTDPLIEAICSIPAETAAGALIQIQALSRFVGLATDDLGVEQHWDRMREHAIASIHQVLSKLVSPAVVEAADAMECMGPGPGPFVTDLGEFELQMKRCFEASDIDLMSKPKSRQRRARV